MARPIGLVLAGGRGRRMGRTKGDLVVDGQGLASRAAGVLQPLCRGVLISLARGAPNPAPGFPAVEDAPPEGRGPLAGIHAAFEATDEADLLILACDYARVETSLLARLLERAEDPSDLVVLSDATDRLHPLVGLWRRGMAAAVAEALESGQYKVGFLADRDRAQRLVPADFPEADLGRALVNLNLRTDLDSLDRS